MLPNSPMIEVGEPLYIIGPLKDVSTPIENTPEFANDVSLTFITASYFLEPLESIIFSLLSNQFWILSNVFPDD